MSETEGDQPSIASRHACARTNNPKKTNAVLTKARRFPIFTAL
jgi:hypothetical protein